MEGKVVLHRRLVPGTLKDGRVVHIDEAKIEEGPKGLVLHLSGCTRFPGKRDWESGGQIQDELLRIVKPADGWTPEMIGKLHATWERWRLNDLRPECPHQRALGWLVLGSQKVNLYHWRQTGEFSKKHDEIEKRALKALTAGETFTPTAEEAFAYRQPYSLTTWEDFLPEAVAGLYEWKKELYKGDHGHVTTKTLGWLRPNEHPEGILMKPCPSCDYKYGSAWLYEALPDEVVQFIRGLPGSTVVDEMKARS